MASDSSATSSSARLEAVTKGLWLCDQRDNHYYLVAYNGRELTRFPTPARKPISITFGAGSGGVASNTRPAIMFRHTTESGHCTAFLVFSEKAAYTFCSGACMRRRTAAGSRRAKARAPPIGARRVDSTRVLALAARYGSAGPWRLEALASVDQKTTLEEVLHRLGQPTYWHGRRVRALQPFAPDDRQLIQAISRGEFTLNGARNRDLQRLCFAQPATSPIEARRRSAWASRQLRLLRAHRLLYEVTGTHRHHVTKAGRLATTAILAALRSSVLGGGALFTASARRSQNDSYTTVGAPAPPC